MVPSARAAEVTPSRPSLPRTVAQAMRPRQWTKNLAVFAALLFAKQVFHPAAAIRSSLAVLAFCFLSSAVYVLNDWVDREKDRLHPLKRQRPIAAGYLGGAGAATLGLTCLAIGVALALSVSTRFGLVAAGYLAIQVMYTFALKSVAIVDVMVIAAGFVVRVIGGGVAIDVPVSNWLFLCTLLLAVFLGFAKRRHELSSLQGSAGAHRGALEEYSLPLLDQMMSIVAAACIVAYGLYAVSQETVHRIGSDRMKFTVPFVIYGIFRYLYLVHRKGEGGSPERLLLSDAGLILDLVLFVLTSAWALYA